MSNFNKPETFYDCQTKNKISFEDFKKKYISNKNFYMISKLNNKLIIQNDEIVNLFSFKNGLIEFIKEGNRLSAYFFFKQNINIKSEKKINEIFNLIWDKYQV